MIDLYYNTRMPIEAARAMQRVRLKTVREMNESGADKTKLSKTLASIAKQYGAGVLAPIKALGERNDVACVSTGFQELDDIISGKVHYEHDRQVAIPGSGRGIPRGRMVEIFGPESSGKTTLTLQIVKAFQERGFRTAFIDAEHALDMDYARRIGVDTDELLYSEGGESAEETLDLTERLVKDEVVDLIIIDSVAALTPQKELDGEAGEQQVGLHARLMSQTCRKLTKFMKRGHRCTIVWVNQTRSKIGGYGNPETTTGGNALKFYASVRLRTSSMGELKQAGKKGIRSKVKCRKTKVGFPFGECFLEITGGTGINAAFPGKVKRDGAKDDDDDSDDE